MTLLVFLLSHADSVGVKFYLVIEGTVGVYMRLPKEQGLGFPAAAPDRGEISHITEDLTCVKELHGGDSFGELALMNNKPRLASIICHTNCHFATLGKKEFFDTLKQKEEEKLTNEMGFFLNMPFFAGWSFG